MKILDGEGLINITPCAFAFTRMMANPSACAGKRMFLLEHLQRFPVFSFIDQRDKPLDANMGRTGGSAWGGSPFADGISAWDGLCILLVYGLSICQAFVIVIGNINRANLDALSTACAF